MNTIVLMRQINWDLTVKGKMCPQGDKKLSDLLFGLPSDGRPKSTN